MSINHEWTIDNIEYVAELNGKNNVVTRIYWRIISSDGENEVSSYDSVNVNFDENSDFIEYKNLEKTEVLKWAKFALGHDEVSKIESNMAGVLENMKIQPKINTGTPW